MKNEAALAKGAIEELREVVKDEVGQVYDKAAEAKQKVRRTFGNVRSEIDALIGFTDEVDDMMNQLSNYPPDDGQTIEGSPTQPALAAPDARDAPETLTQVAPVSSDGQASS